jgi:hypothetical protein
VEGQRENYAERTYSERNGKKIRVFINIFAVQARGKLYQTERKKMNSSHTEINEPIKFYDKILANLLNI